jgi:mycofactocin precursor
VDGSTERVNEPGSGVLSRAGARSTAVGTATSSLAGLGTGPFWQPIRRVRLAACSEEVGVLAEDHEVGEDMEALSDDDVDELLVEEVSIDGMCGVY